MTIVLILLNIIFLFFNLGFNAELLNLAGTEITLKSLEEVTRYGQVISAFGMILLVWKLIATHLSGKRLLAALGISLVLIYPLTYWIQGKIPDVILKNVEHKHRVASLYAYVIKKGFIGEAISLNSLPYRNAEDEGASRAFIANLGLLMNAENDYMKRIDGNFQTVAEKIFIGYWKTHEQELYQRFVTQAQKPAQAIGEQYLQLEKDRLAASPGLRRLLDPVAFDGARNLQGGSQPDTLAYANALPAGIRDPVLLTRQAPMQVMAADQLGPLYVPDMNLLANRDQFRAYIPTIAKNMATQVAYTDVDGPQGDSIIRNMIFLPVSLLSSLFFGVSSLVMLSFALVEAVIPVVRFKRKLKIGLLACVVVVPLVMGNEMVNSRGYIELIRKSGDELVAARSVLHWAMVAEGWLYNLRVYFVRKTHEN